MKRLLAVAVAVALVAAAALAQSDQPAPKKAGGKKPGVQVMIFTPDQITGEADSPNGVVIETVQRPEFPTFFKVRENFDDKLRDSINEL